MYMDQGVGHRNVRKLVFFLTIMNSIARTFTASFTAFQDHKVNVLATERCAMPTPSDKILKRLTNTPSKSYGAITKFGNLTLLGDASCVMPPDVKKLQIHRSRSMTFACTCRYLQIRPLSTPPVSFFTKRIR